MVSLDMDKKEIKRNIGDTFPVNNASMLKIDDKTYEEQT